MSHLCLQSDAHSEWTLWMNTRYQALVTLTLHRDLDALTAGSQSRLSQLCPALKGRKTTENCRGVHKNETQIIMKTTEPLCSCNWKAVTRFQTSYHKGVNFWWPGKMRGRSTAVRCELCWHQQAAGCRAQGLILNLNATNPRCSPLGPVVVLASQQANRAFNRCPLCMFVLRCTLNLIHYSITFHVPSRYRRDQGRYTPTARAADHGALNHHVLSTSLCTFGTGAPFCIHFCASGLERRAHGRGRSGPAVS